MSVPPGGFPRRSPPDRNGFLSHGASGELLLVAGGEQGEMLGYDLIQRLALTFAGSASSQLNGLEPVAGQPGKFFILRNNAPGFACWIFQPQLPRSRNPAPRSLRPALLGALRFNRMRDVMRSNSPSRRKPATAATSRKAGVAGRLCRIRTAAGLRRIYAAASQTSIQVAGRSLRPPRNSTKRPCIPSRKIDGRCCRTFIC